MFGNQDIFKDSQGAEETDVLEGPGNAQFGNLVWCLTHGSQVRGSYIALIEAPHFALGRIGQYDLTVKGYGTKGGLVNTCDTVESSGFACPVGPDEGHDFVFIYIQGQSVHCHDAAELHGDALHMQYIFYAVFHVVHQWMPPFLAEEGFFLPFLNLPGMPRMSRNSPSQENSWLPMIPRL